MIETVSVSREWLARHICLSCRVKVELADGGEWVTLHRIDNAGELFYGRNDDGAEILFKPEAILEVA